MIVGIMSDSHDDMKQIQKAIDLFNTQKVGQVIHAGDMCSPFTYDLMQSLEAPFTGIFGNNDGDRVLIRRRYKDAVHIQPLTLELEGKKIVVVHEPIAVDALADSGHYDVVIFGHTHIAVNKKQGKALVINPGKTATLHKGESTVCVLDTATMEAEIINLD